MPLPIVLAGAAAALGKVFIDKAPDVASWIFGDKSGKAVETVTGIAREVLGVDDATGIEAAIARDSALALQFQMAVMAAREQERQAALETLRTQLADVQSARGQTVALAQAGSPLAWGAPLVSILVVLIFGVVMYFAMTRVIPESRFNDGMLGILSAAFMAVIYYWLGSSAGSANKDAIMHAFGRRQQ